MMIMKYCDKKCVGCKWCHIVEMPDPDDWFNDDDKAIYCSNPNNNMEKEWTSLSQRRRVIENEQIKFQLESHDYWTFIAGMLRPYELGKDKMFANKESEVIL